MSLSQLKINNKINSRKKLNVENTHELYKTTAVGINESIHMKVFTRQIALSLICYNWI